jgi:hypothetical protein
MDHTKHSPPFEISYLRDRTLKVAALQNQGHILMSNSPPDQRTRISFTLHP